VYVVRSSVSSSAIFCGGPGFSGLCAAINSGDSRSPAAGEGEPLGDADAVGVPELDGDPPPGETVLLHPARRPSTSSGTAYAARRHVPCVVVTSRASGRAGGVVRIANEVPGYCEAPTRHVSPRDFGPWPRKLTIYSGPGRGVCQLTDRIDWRAGRRLPREDGARRQDRRPPLRTSCAGSAKGQASREDPRRTRHRHGRSSHWPDRRVAASVRSTRTEAGTTPGTGRWTAAVAYAGASAARRPLHVTYCDRKLYTESVAGTTCAAGGSVTLDGDP
jgi:hypothetical protein